MKMPFHRRQRRLIAWTVIISLNVTQVGQVAALTLATTPLAATTTSVVRPNLMYVLDDSGSMAWDYTPDYINDSTTAADPGSTGGSYGDGAIATISGGAVTAIGPDGSPPSFSHIYNSAPAVVIEGTTGTGATAVANWSSSTKKITSITVTNGGSGYTTVPHVSLVGPLPNATWGMCWGTTGTSNAGGTPKDTNQSPTCTSPTQLPYATAAINYQYYDPSVTYQLPYKADGTRYPAPSPTSASNNGYGSGTSINLTSAWTHEVWCNTSTATPSAADPTAGGKCRENLDSSPDPTTSATPSQQYTTTFYPNATYNFRKTYTGPAFYYVMSPAEYCTDDSLSNCARSTAPTVSGGSVYNIPANFRWCAYYNPQTHAYGGCQAHRDITHYIPNYLGGWVSTGTPGVQATAALQILGVSNGQKLTSVTVDGVDVVGGLTFTAGAADTPTTIATQVCTAIQSNIGNTGYGCAMSGSNAVIQAAIVGSAANGKEVIASGPADSAATQATVSFQVASAPTGAQIDSIRILRPPGYSTDYTELLSASVLQQNNSVSDTAAEICNQIKAGPGSATYEVRSRDSGDNTVAWGTCSAPSGGNGLVEIRRKDTASTDDNAHLSITGPSGNVGTITVGQTSGATRIDDIKATVGGVANVSIVPNSGAYTKPWTYADGTQTQAIAADIAARIAAYSGTSGCTAVVSPPNSSTVQVSGTCSGTITVSSTAVAATGKFRIASSGSTNPGDLGGIQVGTANLVGHVTSSQLTDTSNVSTSATAITSAITSYQAANFAAGSRFSASAAANGSYYDVTVTAPAGNTYNGQSFTFAAGTPNSGATGTQPQWTFSITNATTDNATLSSITCGGTAVIPSRNTGTTSGNVTYVRNLATALNGASSAGLSGYNYSCSALTSPQYRCTVTGPAGAPACSTLAITKDPTISLSTTTPSASGGANASSNHWDFTVTDAQTDNMSISQIRCGPTAGSPSTSGGTRMLNSSASTGTSVANNYVQSLASALGNNSYDGTVGPSSFRGTNNSFVVSGNSINATISRWSDGSGGAACPGGSLTISKTGSTMTVGPVTQHHDNNYDGITRYYYTFTISNVTAPNESIDQIACSGASGQTTLTGSASTGASNPSQKLQRLENLRSGLDGQSRNSFTLSCPTASTNSGFSCTATGPSTCTSSSLWFQGNSNSTGIYIGGSQLTTSSNFGTFTAGTAATSPTWTFDITNATDANKTISGISCMAANGTNLGSILPATAPSTGTDTSTAAQRINNLTGAVAPSTSGSIGSNGYTMSCQPAVAGTGASCTLTGPVGVAACNADAANGFVINKDSSISFGTVTRTQAGSAAGSPTIDFAPYLSTLQAFSGGYAPQNTTATSIVALSTIPTSPATPTFSTGAPSATLAINTNTAGGTSGLRLNLAGGSDPNTATNHWKDVGIFKRVDIVSGATYARSSGRTDCVGSTCTYSEELQNFANWYTYYRTRENMMKSATTIAFIGLDSNYRVGFDNICNATGTSVKRGVAQFGDSNVEVANQKSSWWSQLVGSTPSCATPLRAETAKIGRYFAGKLSGATDPLQYSCQQNFMILVTDGYWNENEPSGTSLTGGDVGNQDNNSTTASYPYYDGQQASTTCPSTGSMRGSSASSCRTLSDIAWYYYSTDLRTSALGNATNPAGTDVSTNNVMTSADDKNTAQHMNFFAMGLGIDGTLQYRSDYQTAGIGDFAAIRAGTLNWPAVANLDPTGVDDLWHATVNGRGKYFSARNLPNVVAGLREALNKIGSRVGSAAAAATSNLQPVTGDNFAYVASYATVDWTGDLQSRSIDITTGDVSPDTNCGVVNSGCQWSAQAKIDNQTWSARRIYAAPSSNATGDPLRPFTWANLSASEQAYFNPSSLSQYAGLSASNAADITAENLVNFLRGERRLEQDGDYSHAQIWRGRAHVLGDIVNTQPIYSKAPNRAYTDAGYALFKSSGAASTRRPVVFISSQDGMLHAINADTAAVTMSGATVQPGEELWAYVPKQAMSSMKVLADTNYTLNHRYFVDGPIMVADVNFGSSANDWHTILVGGQGGGGTSYFALDITDPVNPAFLWEISPSSSGLANLGYTFSNPTAAKLPNGEWAVFFSSGYNNADGRGYLYAVNPKTGAVKTGFPMTTSSGTPTSPSNLGKIGVWVNNPAEDNTAQFVYAGDFNGDVWRFDLDIAGAGHSGTDVFKLAHLPAAGSAEPITTKPELTTGPNGEHIVFVGTGKYLEVADLTDTTMQGFYAIKDTLGASNLAGATSQQTWSPTTDTLTVSGSTVPAFLQRKLISTDRNGSPLTQVVNGVTTAYRKVCSGASSQVSAASDNPPLSCTNESTTTMDWATYAGWYVQFPDTGERMNVDMKLTKGTLVFATNIPSASSCTVGGSAWGNFLDYNTGLQVADETAVSVKIPDSLVVGITVVKLPSGTYKAIITKSNYQQETLNVRVNPSNNTTSSPFQSKRSSWREFELY